MTKIKVAVGLSGGVDSAVSAYLLKKQGFDISGVYLHCFDDDAPGCRGKQDRQDAVKVALHLKIPFQVLDFSKQYKSAVIGYFKKEYLAGRTPNPDVICNRDIKFGLLLDWCVKNGFDYLATGHYAKLVSTKTIEDRAWKVGVEDRRLKIDKSDLSSTIHPLLPSSIFHHLSSKKSSDVFLARPADEHKDQTYFLWAVPRQNFSRVLFPLADFRKNQVRSLAKFAKIPVADKPDSTGICFIGEVRVEDFLKRLGVKEKEGEVVMKVTELRLDSRNLKIDEEVGRLKVEREDSGLSIFNFPTSNSSFQRPASNFKYEVIGRHRGVAFYTIGQRHGFTINPKGLTFAKQRLDLDIPPLYVIAKDVRRNRLIVGFGPDCYRDNFQVSDCNWLASEKDSPSVRGRTVLCRIRHLGDLIPCSLSVNSEQLIDNGGSPFTIYDSPLSVHRSLFTVHLRFAQRGIAAGQSAVFYDNTGIVLGGGIIQ